MVQIHIGSEACFRDSREGGKVCEEQPRITGKGQGRMILPDPRADMSEGSCSRRGENPRPTVLVAPRVKLSRVVGSVRMKKEV